MKRIIKYLAYTAAALVIVLAIAVGLFRLMLPKLPEYQEQIKAWATAAIGAQVEFSGMDARWRLSGPELNFYDARLVSGEDDSTLLNVQEISVGVALARLLLDRELVADRILIRNTDVEVVQAPDGVWRVQGIAVEDFLDSSRVSSGGEGGSLTVVGEDIRVHLRRPAQDLNVALEIETLNFQRDARQRSLDALLRLPSSLGRELQVAATQRRDGAGKTAPWQFFVEGQGLDAAALSRLWPDGGVHFAGGSVDLSLWLDLSDGVVQRATANFGVTGLVADNQADRGPVSASGRAEFAKRGEEWLVAADELVLRTVNGSWPQASLQVRVADGSWPDAARIDVSASYLDLDDWQQLAAWFPAAIRERLAVLAPSGELRDLTLSLTRSEGSPAAFELSAELQRAGIAAAEPWPGFRGFSGTVRADQSGGRIEMDARQLTVDLSAWLPEPVSLQRAAGTVIWRRGADGTTILSDSVRLQNLDFDSQSSMQVTLPAGDVSPVIDLHSNWSVSDISTVERYLPEAKIKPALYRWLTNALVAGSAPSGTTRFSGSLDRFPFAEGDGEFRIEARIEDAILRYADSWPAVNISGMDAVLDGARLYTEHNAATSLGNEVIDAQVEIPDLRTPVLHIDASARGTLETIRDFSRRSPIAALFGGQLDKAQVSGDASFDLQLSYPILDRLKYVLTTTIRPEQATVRFDGFPAPVTGLHGAVTVSRQHLQAEGLTGTFLGAPVDIELTRIADETVPYGVVAKASGVVGAEALIDELSLPLADVVAGATDYDLTIRFPRAGAEEPRPVQIDIESALSGMAVNLPQPIGKPAGTARPFSATIALRQQDRIETAGQMADNVRWSVGFNRGASGWDFDRGVLAVGGAAPGDPGSRGLHIEGRTPSLDIDEWLDVASGDGTGPGLGARIRSIDLEVDDLYVIGQHLTRHHLVVNRSALDWAVQLDGEQAVGSVSIPYDLSGPRPLVLDMKALTLPGNDAADEAETTVVETRIDPRTLPRITVSAEQFVLGKRKLGSLQADFAKTAAGLEAESVIAESESFDINGRAGWVVDGSDPTGQRSYFSARLTSSDVERTMQQLDYQPGIESEAMDVRLDVSWSGGPQEEFLSSLDGNVSVHFGTGQLDDVEPGAGRVFGLMSIVALPRRLSLDFRDVFERGFVFDEITGSFRVEDGEAYTCDLSLKGPAADVGIVGRTGLVARDYDQAAVVSANVGNTLPLVGAVVAGPQVAAALLIFSQIFKKPLQEMGQIYYGIDGSWADPVIDASNPQGFAEASSLAGCIDRAD